MVQYPPDRGSRGGGVMVTLEESGPFLSLPSPEGLEVVTFHIRYNQVDLTVCSLHSSKL